MKQLQKDTISLSKLTIYTSLSYGAGDFFCKFCSEELSNVYMHCDGCEKLLDKDFNICSTCHQAGAYKISYQMHPFNAKPHSILNHTGCKTFLRRARCPCKNGKECQYCTYCTGCSCRCHQHFTLHYRFMGPENELEILKKAQSIVGSDEVPQAAETKARLFSLISEEEEEEEEPTNGKFCEVIDEGNKKPANTKSSESTRASAKKGSVVKEDSVEQEKGPAAGCPRCLSELKTGRPSRVAHAEDCPLNVGSARKVAPTTNVKQDSKPSTKNKKKKVKASVSMNEGGDASTGAIQKGKWSEEEHEAFLEGRRICGEQWTKISQEFVPTRTGLQVRKHAALLGKKEGGDDSGQASWKKAKADKTKGNMGGKSERESLPKRVNSIGMQSIKDNDAAQISIGQGPWSEEEHTAFLEGHRTCGNQWTKISREFVPSRTKEQIRTYAKGLIKEGLDIPGLGKSDAAKKSDTSGKRVIPRKKRKKNNDINEENTLAPNNKPKAAKQPNEVVYTCPKCQEDFKFAPNKSAAEKFESHIKHCSGHEPESKRARAQKGLIGSEESSSNNSQNEETKASGNESHTEEENNFNTDELKPGDGVIVQCGKGQNWQATIIRPSAKKGRPGFMVNYKGLKKDHKNWIPNERVVGFNTEES